MKIKLKSPGFRSSTKITSLENLYICGISNTTYVQVQLFPGTNMIFTNNSAQRLGGAIGVDNVRVEEDLALILNYNCFLQYNIGNEDEFYPSNWKVFIHL